MFFKSQEQKFLDELKGLNERLAEDRIYQQVMIEIDSDELDSVSRARAFEEAEGDNQKAQGLYVKHRVRRLRDLALDYENWLKEEAKMKALRKKEEQEEQEKIEQRKKEEQQKKIEHRKQLSESMRAGKMPPREIQMRYKSEYNNFYENWVKEEYARRKFARSASWHAFLIEISLID